MSHPTEGYKFTGKTVVVSHATQAHLGTVVRRVGKRNPVAFQVQGGGHANSSINVHHGIYKDDYGTEYALANNQMVPLTQFITGKKYKFELRG